MRQSVNLWPGDNTKCKTMLNMLPEEWTHKSLSCLHEGNEIAMTATCILQSNAANLWKKFVIDVTLNYLTDNTTCEGGTLNSMNIPISPLSNVKSVSHFILAVIAFTYCQVKSHLKYPDLHDWKWEERMYTFYRTGLTVKDEGRDKKRRSGMLLKLPLGGSWMRCDIVLNCMRVLFLTIGSEAHVDRVSSLTRPFLGFLTECRPKSVGLLNKSCHQCKDTLLFFTLPYTISYLHSFASVSRVFLLHRTLLRVRQSAH